MVKVALGEEVGINVDVGVGVDQLHLGRFKGSVAEKHLDKSREPGGVDPTNSGGGPLLEGIGRLLLLQGVLLGIGEVRGKIASDGIGWRGEGNLRLVLGAFGAPGGLLQGQ